MNKVKFILISLCFIVSFCKTYQQARRFTQDIPRVIIIDLDDDTSKIYRGRFGSYPFAFIDDELTLRFETAKKGKNFLTEVEQIKSEAKEQFRVLRFLTNKEGKLLKAYDVKGESEQILSLLKERWVIIDLKQIGLNKVLILPEASKPIGKPKKENQCDDYAKMKHCSLYSFDVEAPLSFLRVEVNHGQNVQISSIREMTVGSVETHLRLYHYGR